MSLHRIEIDVELDDGSEHHITVANPSLVAWDRTRATRKWPTVDEAPMVWLTFIAWHHMKALGLVDCSHEDFESTRCVAISSDEDETADGEAPSEDGPTVDPTRPALESVSASS